MRKYRHVCGCICLACMGIVLTAETAHLSHAAVCLEQTTGRDMAPPESCNEPVQQHSRNVSISTLATRAAPA